MRRAIPKTFMLAMLLPPSAIAEPAHKPAPAAQTLADTAVQTPSSELKLRPHRPEPRPPRLFSAPGIEQPATAPVPVRLVLSNADGAPLAWLDGLLPSAAVARQAVAGEIGVTFALPDKQTRFSESGDLGVAPGLRFHAGRATGFATGGVDGQTAETGRVHGFVDAGGTRFDLYDISLRWDAFDPGPFTVTLLGGVRAIDAQTGIAPESPDPLNAGDQRDVVAVPVVGGGLRWNLADGVYFSGTAATHTLDTSGTFVGLTAETGIELSPRVGVFAGYHYIRSALDVESFADELSQEGVFARLEINF